MLINLALGTVIICATVVIHIGGLMAVTRAIGWIGDRIRLQGHRNRIVGMVTTVLGIFCVITVEVWLWAGAFFALAIFPDFETALYFSIVSFCTLGYGDVLPAHPWRILAALEGVNGFLLIGWSTAYLVAAGIRVGPFRTGEHF